MPDSKSLTIYLLNESLINPAVFDEKDTIVGKLRNLCNILRDDGITYHQYVTELTHILFLKMAKETDTEEQIPNGYRWENLSTKSGIELKKCYKELLV